MTRVVFYLLGPEKGELPVAADLLETCLRTRQRAYVAVRSQQRAIALSDFLHANRPSIFVPHEIVPEGAGEQPGSFRQSREIAIGTDFRGGKGADLLMLFDGAPLPPHAGDFSTVCYLFSGTTEESLGRARRNWHESRIAGHQLAFFAPADNTNVWRRFA